MQRDATARLKTAFSGSASDAWRTLLRRCRFHAIPLAIVLALAVGCQALVLLRGGWPPCSPARSRFICR